LKDYFLYIKRMAKPGKSDTFIISVWLSDDKSKFKFEESNICYMGTIHKIGVFICKLELDNRLTKLNDNCYFDIVIINDIKKLVNINNHIDSIKSEIKNILEEYDRIIRQYDILYNELKTLEIERDALELKIREYVKTVKIN
jgi:hypothetical protein